MTEPIEVQTITLADERRTGGDGDEPAALYVMVAADGFSARIGALEKARIAKPRLLRVEKKHPTQTPTPPPECFPIRLALVGTLEGLVLGPAGDQFYERWAEVEHLESALRLVLARRLGRLAGWTDWIHIDKPVGPDRWSGLVEGAWGEVSRLGRTGPASPH